MKDTYQITNQSIKPLSSSKQSVSKSPTDQSIKQSNFVQCIKPSWIEHDHLPVLSIDLNQSINRLVTGGADHQVKIWLLDAITDRIIERSTNIPKLLCVMGNHESAVNVVRFSPDGTYIASGADGHSPSILIWKRLKQSINQPINPSSGTISKTPSHEKWSLVAHLRGHTMDVQDLAFDSSGRYIASASVDNTVIIWDIQSINQSNNQSIKPYRILRGHDSWVKGVAWDPIGRYLASFSDNNRLIIWDIHDQYSIKQTITEGLRAAFFASPSVQSATAGANRLSRQVVFSRLSWAPDGQSLAVSRGYTAGQTDKSNKRSNQLTPRFPASHIYLRNNSTPVVSLMGHGYPTVVTKFNPHCWVLDPSISQTSTVLNVRRSGRTSSQSNRANVPSIFGIIAVGSMDESITVWATNKSTGPIAHIKPFAINQSVEDLAWSADGLTLVASSHDGSVAAFVFHPSNFGGRRLTDNELKAHLSDLYGDHSGTQFDLIESALTMEYITANQATSQPITPDVVNPISTQSINLAAVQTESRRADGKRKVRPINLEPDPLVNSSVSQLSLPPELAFDADKSNENASKFARDNIKAVQDSPVNGDIPQHAIDQPQILNQKELDSAVTDSKPPPSQSTNGSSGNVVAPPKRKRDGDLSNLSAKRKKTSIQSGLPSNKERSDVIPTSSTHPKEQSASPLTEPLANPPALAPSVDVRAQPTSIPPSTVTQTPKYLVEPLRSLNQFLAYQPTHLDSSPIVPLAPPISADIHATSQSVSQRVIEANVTRSKQAINGVKAWTMIKCFDPPKGSQPDNRPVVEHWRTLLPHACVSLKVNQSINQSTNQSMIVCVTRDGERCFLHLMNGVGRVLYQPIVVASPVAYLEVHQASNSASSHLALVTCDGELKVFNLLNNHCFVSKSVKSLLFETGTNVIVDCHLVKDSQPMITINQTIDRSVSPSNPQPHNQSIYVFDRNLDSWLSIANTEYYASDLHSLIKQVPSSSSESNSSINIHSLQLVAIQAMMNEKGTHSALLSTSQSIKQMHTIHHIETQLAIAQSIRLPDSRSVDYQRWSYLYVQQLSKMIDQYKDELSINQSINPNQRTLFSMHQFATVRLMDFLNTLMLNQSSLPDQLSVLQSILPIIVNNRQLQRLATQVAESISNVKSRANECRDQLVSGHLDVSSFPPVALFGPSTTRMQSSEQ